MAKGPRGEKRPADMVGAAIKVARISTGEEAEDALIPDARSKRGQRGAMARSAKLTDAQRSEIAKTAADARWTKTKS